MDGSNALNLPKWTLRITGKVSDPIDAAKALKDAVGGSLNERKALVIEGVIGDLSRQEAWDAKLALDGLGISSDVEKNAVIALVPSEAPTDAELEARATLAQELAARFAAVPTDDETGRLKGWLEIAENESDVVLLVAAAGLLTEGGAPEHLVNVILDRVAVLQRPQPGETKVLYEGTAELEVDLNDHEQIEASRELAKLAREKARTDSEMKSTAKRYKARIELLDEEIEKQLDIIEKGKAKRNVPTRTEIDFGTGLVRTIRLDTMAVISERKADEDELQCKLPFDESRDEDDQDDDGFEE